ncbi:MAG: bifunctional acetate--CoA ligase family protein/GNAT family N-acetyltransferase [Deltaproteobacteria bacterium]|nr:bifunctional acetate--CoA ligase family protein/GNAT family N-acetyltransferase [Deltaproteobacteria bacterium]
MSIFNLEKIFKPSAIAVVGASRRENSVGEAVMRNLTQCGYEGSIFPVNPKYEELFGLTTHASIRDIEAPLDLAVITTPIETVPSIVEACASRQVGAAIILSAGGKEAGDEGRAIEARIREIAYRGKVRIIGPNCLGVLCAGVNLNASFANHMTLPGRLAFISQSGALCTAILDIALHERIGFSHFVSIGSMLDVDFGDIINYLGNDPEVSSIALYVENLSNFRKFMGAARAVSRVKPIVVLKSGRSPAGARAAASHTGALAGEDAVYDAAFKRAGIARVQTIEELFDCAELMAKQPRPGGPGLAIITNAGGPGVMAADALALYGMEPVTLNAATIARLDECLPRYWSRGNPVDIIGDATPDRYRDAVRICMAAPEVNSLLVILTPQALTNPTAVAESVTRILERRRVSIFTVWMGAGDVEKGREIFNRAGIPTYETPERAVHAFMTMYRYSRNLEMLQEIPPKLPRDLRFNQREASEIIQKGLEEGRKFLDEVESKRLLAAYGIPVNPTEAARSEDEAVAGAGAMGYPVVVKIHAKGISHKTDVDGVMLNLRNESDVRRAFRQVVENALLTQPDAEILGVTVQPMLKGHLYELIVGSVRDRDFGPVILFGMGGIMAEVLKDRALALPPLNRLLARRLMEDTRVFQLLKGYRNRPGINLLLVEEVLIRLSHLVADFPQIVELDVNPLVPGRDQVWAVDARVAIEPSEITPPMHLVISSYPVQHEKQVVTRGGIEVLLRPVKPEDGPLLVDLFNTLSPTSIYFRFFRPIKYLSHEMLARFTQIDYDRDIVLVAIDQRGESETMLGVVRLMGDPDATRAEFAIVVGDPWQGKGVGAALLEHCLSIAADRGMREVWGYVLPENTTMLALGRKVGFSVTRVPGAGEFELRIALYPGWTPDADLSSEPAPIPGDSCGKGRRWGSPP